jgi:hypothetical protein
MKIGIKNQIIHRTLGKKRSNPMHVTGKKGFNYLMNSTLSPSNKESHDVYNHQSNSEHVHRMPMLYGSHEKNKTNSHIEKHKKLSIQIILCKLLSIINNI